MALLEAMAAGRACVVSDLPELAGTLQDAGLAAASGDAAALAGALERLRADGPLRARLGRAARAAVQRFSIDASAERYRDLYANIAAERGLEWR